MAKSPYHVSLARSAVKTLRKLPQDVRRRVVRAIEPLQSDPRPHGAKKLTGTEDLYRLRCGDYRIIYQIDDRNVTLLVVRIGHRGDVYRPGT